MKIATLYLFVLLSTAGCAPIDSIDSQESRPLLEVPNILSGTWALRIWDLEGNAVGTATIRFGEDEAISCIGGSWKNIVIVSSSSDDAQLFPASEPWSYELRGNELTMGRNSICDAYLHLVGTIQDSSASGEYVAFGWSSELLGHFSLERTTE